MRTPVAIVLLLFPLWLKAGNENLPVGARSSAIGHASVNLQDIWAAHHNQAGLANLEKIGGGIYYESRFTMRELSLRGGLAALPTDIGTFAVSVTTFGYELYNESKFGLAYAMPLSDNLRMGVQLNYHHTHIAEGIGNLSHFTGEIGLQADITDELSIGAHVFNPTLTQMAEYNNERIPTAIRLGAQYQFNENFFLAVEGFQNIYDRPSMRIGMEYHVIEQLYLRGGVGTTPTLASFGFGLKLKNLFIDLASSYHSTLGFSPQVSLSYNMF
ncbi:MAG: hypothetical protein EA392_03700 [Cryomorphaceae bacterium]|nr:MAG: hypothetical protein EA392_03700 [Cryomorphaceae bacterium]